MPIMNRDGVRISYDDRGGTGPLAVLVMGTGSPGRVWHTHQVPALRAAGFRVVTLDNRGVGASDECAAGFTIDDMVGDLAALVDRSAAYRDVTVPLLVVAFADDATIPPRLCREVADAVPGARYVEIPDAGHYGYLERPDEVNRVLLDFLAAS